MAESNRSAPGAQEFILKIASPPELEFLVSEIWVSGERVAIIDQEDGRNRCTISFESNPMLRIPLDEFIAFASAARDHLLDGEKPSPIAVLQALREGRRLPECGNEPPPH